MRFDPTWNDPDRFAGIRRDYGPIDVEGLAGSFQICCGRVSTRLPLHQSWCRSLQCGTKIALATAWVLASTHLADRVATGDQVRVFVRPSHGLHLPASPDALVIMIGPGTGIAPFRAFLQERLALGARRRNWLFFGNPRRSCDFLFEEELTGYGDDGLLTRLDLAFSRDQEGKVYVQHRFLEHAAELWSWLEEGPHLNICGDAQRMAQDVEAGLCYIIAKEGRIDAAAAKAYLGRLARKSLKKTSTEPE